MAKARKKEEVAKLEAAREALEAFLPWPKIKCAGVKVITKKTKTGTSLDVRLDEK